MSKPWHEANPDLFARVRQEIRETYPTLHFSVRNTTVFLRGSFPLLDGGTVIDRYSIEIELPRNYPEDLPLVREIGGRIPKTSDRHFYTNGVACLFLPDERWWVFPKGSSLLDFLNGPVRNFFIGQSLVERGQPWPFGQRGHGATGILEFYTELLRTDNLTTINRYLDILGKKDIKSHWPCPCGSGKPLRDCHIAQIIGLRRKIPRAVARRSHKSLDER